ncbi:snaclec bothroinsularin subunit alpha-like [Asterias amurensis]|uniref:snaclec bothroinsularin subunit alpha-like n=1 Tax=Asterias amurensis TaxID=7602 RepID=UPI003AB23B04
MNLLYLRVILLGVCCGQPVAATCPSDWHRYGESWYVFLMDKMNWYQAKHTCGESRANLVIPNSQSEQNYIWELILNKFNQTPSTDLWIGCNDIEEEGNWQHCPLKGEINAYENGANRDQNPIMTVEQIVER